MSERLGVLGAGRLGTAVARLAVAAGRDVLIADVRSGPMVELVVSTVAAGAGLVPVEEMLAASDIVVLAIPYSRLPDLDLAAYEKVVVVDATNAWREVDGADPPPSPLRRHGGLRLVRTLNHLAHEDLTAYAEPKGAPFRTAMAVASEDLLARAAVAALVDELGFDPVELDWRSAWMLESNGPLFGRRLSREEMTSLVSAARRADRLTW